MSDIQRDMSNTIQCRADHLLHLGLNFLTCPKSRCAHELTAAAIVRLTYTNVSQGSVVSVYRQAYVYS